MLPTCGGWCLVWCSNKKEGNIKPYRIDVRCVFERSYFFQVSNEQKKGRGCLGDVGDEFTKF